MLRIFRNKKAQSTAEYAILIGLVVAALIAMQTYVRRGLNVRMKEVADTYATNGGGSLTQYEPYYLTQSTGTQTNQSGSESENADYGGAITRGSNLTTNRTGNAAVGF